MQVPIGLQSHPEQTSAALGRMLENDVKYRFVMNNSSLR
jgi:hypothetical protein